MMCLKFKFTAVASSSSSSSTTSFTSSSSSSSHTSALHHPRRPHSKHFSARQLLHLSFHNLPITEICKGSTLERRGRGRRGGRRWRRRWRSGSGGRGRGPGGVAARWSLVASPSCVTASTACTGVGLRPPSKNAQHPVLTSRGGLVEVEVKIYNIRIVVFDMSNPYSSLLIFVKIIFASDIFLKKKEEKKYFIDIDTNIVDSAQAEYCYIFTCP